MPGLRIKNLLCKSNMKFCQGLTPFLSKDFRWLVAEKLCPHCKIPPNLTSTIARGCLWFCLRKHPHSSHLLSVVAREVIKHAPWPPLCVDKMNTYPPFKENYAFGESCVLLSVSLSRDCFICGDTEWPDPFRADVIGC